MTVAAHFAWSGWDYTGQHGTGRDNSNKAQLFPGRSPAAKCSCLAMAAQVVQEAPGGGDGAGGAVDGLGGGAGRGSLHAGA